MRCAAREGADANQRTNDTMARDALPVHCCPAHSGFVYLSAKLTTGGKRRSTRVFLAKIRREWKSAGKENNIGGKESAMADGERKHLFPTRHSISSQKPTAKIANVPRMGREGGKFAGNCLSLPQSGIALETISLSCSKNLPLSTRVSNFICGGGDRPTEAEAATAVAGNFPWQSLPSLPSHPPSPSSSLWCQCGDEPKECSTLCGAPISSIKSTGGWHSNSSEGGGGTMAAGNTCE